MKCLKYNKRIIETVLCLGFILLGLVFLESQPIWGQASFILAFLIGGYEPALEGWKELVEERHLNVDVLMVLAALGAGIIGYWLEGALLIFIFALSGTLEELAMKKSQDAITALMALRPDKAWRILSDGQLEEVETGELMIGDRLRVKKGQAVPIDGKLISDWASLDEAMVTGEPIPADKAAGDLVLGGTLNVGAELDMVVTVAQEDTLFAKIVALVKQAQGQKSRVSSLIENLEDGYVKAVLFLVPTFIVAVHFLLGWSWLDSFYRGMILLTVASPCALVASSTPAVLAAISRAARMGVMVKGGQIMAQIGDVNLVVMDKTGTLTQGQPQVEEAWFAEEATGLNALVATAEATSTHPVAQAILNYVGDYQAVNLGQLEDVTGRGFTCAYQGHDWRIGKADFVLEVVGQVPADLEQVLAKQEAAGKTLVLVSRDQELVAWYALFDRVKAESKATVELLHELGVQVVMMTGDHQAAAQTIANDLGIDQVQANCLPDDKARLVADYKAQGYCVAMVGDGINDAPALAQSDVSFAIGSGTDIAMETADCVIMDDLTRVPQAIRLSRRMKTIIMQNIIFALAVIVCLIAANVFQVVSLPLGVVGHEGSTILVILNGLRLLGFRHNPSDLKSVQAAQVAQ